MPRRQFVAALGAMAPDASLGRAARAATLRGTLTQLTRPGQGDNRATYLPDGSAVLFASKRTGRSQIWTMDPDGGAPRRRHESAANDYGRIAPSPDGARLCFSSDRSGENVVYVLDLRSGAVTPISDARAWSFGPTWSSRDRIAYFSRRGGNRLNVWTVAPDGVLESGRPTACGVGRVRQGGTENCRHRCKRRPRAADRAAGRRQRASGVVTRRP
jgi:dipeptidyl aminopeptidase/acylaminoacyl peptidase